MKQQRMTVGQIKKMMEAQIFHDKEFLNSTSNVTPTLEMLSKAERAEARYEFCTELLGRMEIVKEIPAKKKAAKVSKPIKEKKAVRKTAKKRGRPKKIQQQ